MANAIKQTVADIEPENMQSYEWINRMNATIEYIESNLTNEIDIAVAASMAYCSEYHFSFIFSFIAGISPSEYIRNRRLTMAGYMLQRSNIKVIDIAYMFGYSSPNSFTRAFIALHGTLPSKARDTNIKLYSYPRLTFSIETGTANRNLK